MDLSDHQDYAVSAQIPNQNRDHLVTVFNGFSLESEEDISLLFLPAQCRVLSVVFTFLPLGTPGPPASPVSPVLTTLPLTHRFHPTAC